MNRQRRRLRIRTFLQGGEEGWDDPQGVRTPCQDLHPDALFPDSRAQHEATIEDVAENVCGVCPAVRACLLGAIERNEKNGTWGGYNFKYDSPPLLKTRRDLLEQYHHKRKQPPKHAAA